MAIPRYLAMTAAEMAKNTAIPENIAWMACHVSSTPPYISHLPQTLPKGSLLTVTDRFPILISDPEPVCDALEEAVSRLSCQGILLDFQRDSNKDSFLLAKVIVEALPCPVFVSDLYAKDLNCPVFLSPVPLHRKLSDHLATWRGRDIWLDVSTEGERIILTEKGADYTTLPRFQSTEGHKEENLHCHYSITLTEAAAEFTLWRTKEDLDELLQEAEKCGIKAAVGLYQELNAPSA